MQPLRASRNAFSMLHSASYSANGGLHISSSNERIWHNVIDIFSTRYSDISNDRHQRVCSSIHNFLLSLLANQVRALAQSLDH